MLWLMKGLVLIVVMGLMLQFCSVRLDDGSRALRVKVDVNDMGGTGLSISVTRLPIDEPSERPRNFR